MIVPALHSLSSPSPSPSPSPASAPVAAPLRLAELRRTLAEGRKGGLARALARLEQAPDSPEVLELLEAAWQDPAPATAQVIGLTGPPGVGKSTLTGALIAALRQQGRRVAVIAVDPSSRRSGGALLGDRVRLATDPEDGGVFVRSMAARDRLGGLAELTVSAMVLLRALFDVVLIETVGVGQSETDVAGVVDTVVFCVQPGSGDSLQFMKAGIVEIPHVVAVTKADLGAPARRALADVGAALGVSGQAAFSASSLPAGGERQTPGDDGWTVPVLAVSASRREGLEALLEALAAHAAYLRGGGGVSGDGNRLVRQRRRQAGLWLEEALRDRFGREGMRLLSRQPDGRAEAPAALLPAGSPFTRLAEQTGRLRQLWQQAFSAIRADPAGKPADQEQAGQERAGQERAGQERG